MSVAAAAAAPPPSRVTPLPVLQILVIVGTNFVNSFVYLLTLPFVPFMVLSFYPDITPAQVGYYSGLIEGSFHFGAFFGSFFWAWAADAYGRRPALLLGLGGTCIMSVLFGLSPTLGVALALKFVWGLLNGNIGVSKTALSELCDDSNTARGFSYIGVATGSGRLFGPMVGGLLSQPALKYPDLFAQDGVFGKFAFLLPCLACAAVTSVFFVIGVLFLKETAGLEEVRRAATAATAAPAGAAAAGRDDDKAALIASPASPAAVPASAARRHCRCAPRAYMRSAAVLMRDDGIGRSTLIYTGLAFIGLLATELFPIYLVADAAHGGFGWGSADVGLLVSFCGPFVLLWCLLLYDRAVLRFGVLAVFRASLCTHALALALTPMCSLALALRGGGGGGGGGEGGAGLVSPHRVEWALITCVFIFSNLSRVTSFNSIFIVVANSAHAADRSTVNGIGQAATSLMRAAGPPLGTALFAWSVSDANVAAGWPRNHFATWYVCALLTLACLAFTYTLPDWIERKRPAGLPVGGGGGQEG